MPETRANVGSSSDMMTHTCAPPPGGHGLEVMDAGSLSYEALSARHASMHAAGATHEHTRSEERAAWDASYIDDLPDSAFLYIEEGGAKDSDGKTTPRSLRHFPVYDSSGSLDLPHLRNALARIPQSSLNQADKDKAQAKAQKLLAASKRSDDRFDEFEVRGPALWPDGDFEFRMLGDGLSFRGYAAVFNLPSLPIPGGPRGPFIETIRPGAFNDTLARKPDITLRTQHNMNMLPLARTKSGTMRLSVDDHGLLAEGSLPDNEAGIIVRDSIRRGDVDGMSIRFRVPSEAGQKWAKDYSTRDLFAVQLGGELSFVDFPAYPDTSVAVRRLAEQLEVDPDVLKQAIDEIKGGQVPPEQLAEVLSATVIATGATVFTPKVASRREQLDALRREAPAA